MVSAKVSTADSKVRSSSITNPWGQKKLKKNLIMIGLKAKQNKTTIKPKQQQQQNPEWQWTFPGDLKIEPIPHSCYKIINFLSNMALLIGENSSNQ